MLKAKALCMVNGNVSVENKPLISTVEEPVPAPIIDMHKKGLHDLIGNLQNIVIESVANDEKYRKPLNSWL